jgi:hypothetical protein
VNERLLRPPGESLRIKLDSLNERINLALLFAMLVPAGMALGIPDLTNLTTLTIFFIVSGLCFLPLVFVLKKYRNYSLGYSGERAVGEELNQLLRDGCHVFHDYPADPKWNIDHIVVAPSGVFLIETKTRRKKRAPKGKREHEIIYDGETLEFPHCRDTYGLDQAKRNAKWLSRELTSATGEPVYVKPILTFPGWFIIVRGKGDVMVWNPKQIRQVILENSPQKLSEAQRQRIVHQLDQKCRDVEF